MVRSGCKQDFIALQKISEARNDFLRSEEIKTESVRKGKELVWEVIGLVRIRIPI